MNIFLNPQHFSDASMCTSKTQLFYSNHGHPLGDSWEFSWSSPTKFPSFPHSFQLKNHQKFSFRVWETQNLAMVNIGPIKMLIWGWFMKLAPPDPRPDLFHHPSSNIANWKITRHQRLNPPFFRCSAPSALEDLILTLDRAASFAAQGFTSPLSVASPASSAPSPVHQEGMGDPWDPRCAWESGWGWTVGPEMV